jgi:hypothetical protein
MIATAAHKAAAAFSHDCQRNPASSFGSSLLETPPFSLMAEEIGTIAEAAQSKAASAPKSAA